MGSKVEIPKCEYRLPLVGRVDGCWKTLPHECEMLEANIIPEDTCDTCKVVEHMKTKEENMTKYRAKLDAVLIQSNPNPDYRVGERRGIVTVGGGKYWPGIYVMIRLLRETGFNDVIQVWYRGDCEKVYPEDVMGLNVEFYDIDAMSREQGNNLIPSGNVKQGGWEAKLYALYHTDLKEVGYIDADAYYTTNPTPLFETLQQAAFIFWEDLPRQENAVKWGSVYPEGKDRKPVPIQGGQLFINRYEAWKLIHAAHYMCQHSHYYFKHLFGDQDTWRVGLSAGCSTYLSLGKAPWKEGVAFVCSHNDIPYVIHRCQGKLFAPNDIPKGKVKYSNPRYNLPKEVEAFSLLAECLGKRIPDSGKAFSEVYRSKLWGEGSGAGSTLKQAQPYIDAVNSFIRRNGIQSVVDCGSGDGLVGSKIEVANYLGLECTDEMVQHSNLGFPGRRYVKHDIYKDVQTIPSADLLLCKDVLHHWPTAMVVKWLEALIESKKWKTILLCQDHKQKSPVQDCHLGGYRALDFQMEPLKRFELVKVCNVLHKHLLRKDLV